MKQFTNLRAAVIAKNNEDEQTENNLIMTGYEHNQDQLLKHYSTARRWEQYQNGEITREKAVIFAQKRASKQYKKNLAEQLEKITEIENAPIIDNFSVSVEWSRSRMWGKNPKAECIGGARRTTGTASGCGYDKESAAVARCLNDNPSILKILYIEIEKALNDDNYKDNHTLLGYGSGYSLEPYFEGGVGVSCFWRILEKLGYTVQEHHATNSSFYHIGQNIPKF